MIAVLVALAIAGVTAGGEQQFPDRSAYFPEPGEAWERRRPEQVGMDPQLLAQAIALARRHGSGIPADFSAQVATFGRQLGALPHTRAADNGILLRHGYIVAEWGDTTHSDPVYSVAKSFLSTLCGLAVDRGLIHSVTDRVAEYIDDGGYASAHNGAITWEHHLRQTSEWEGTLWGKAHDFAGSEEFGAGRRAPRALRSPGSYWEYNDVRVNRLALSLLGVWRRPLPDVLREAILTPIGASQSWRYLAYDNAFVEIDGRRMPSVSGGTRWGGGLWMNARDAARFGYLFLREGRWVDRQIISREWVRSATRAAAISPDYGFLWWLNSDRALWPYAPESSFAALGYGSNIIWIDPEHDLVLVWRWYDEAALNELIRALLQSLRSPAAAPSRRQAS